MAARVIHFGIDACYRVSVLRRAGYEIEKCNNLDEICGALDSNDETDAVMVNDSDGSLPSDALFLMRTRTTAPIILFPNSARSYRAEEIDLVVPAFTPPEEWLLDLATLIVHTRALRAYSYSLQEQSQLPPRESLAARVRSIRERERARKIAGGKFPSPFNPEVDSK